MNTASPDDIDISTVWRSAATCVAQAHSLSLLTGGMTYAALSTFPPRYTSEAQIEVVVPKDGSDRSFDSVTSRLDKEAINTHLRSLMSPDLALKIIAEEKLASNPEFNSALQPPSKLDKVMSMFSGSGAAEERAGSPAQGVLQAPRSLLAEGKPRHRHPLHVRRSQARRRRRQSSRRDLSYSAGDAQPRTDGRRAERAAAEDRQAREGSGRGGSRGRALPRTGQHLQGRPQQHRPQPAAARRHHLRADTGAGGAQRSRCACPVGARDGSCRHVRSRFPTCSVRR